MSAVQKNSPGTRDGPVCRRDGCDYLSPSAAQKHAKDSGEQVSVILCAAGKGLRAGFGKNKLLLPLPGTRESVLAHAAKAFLRDDVHEIVVAVSADDRTEAEKILAPFRICRTVLGGITRTDSVRNALAAVTGDIVLIHDGARPYVSQRIITDCIACVREHRSGICALPFTDTAVLAEDMEITGTPSRESLYTVQTPQGFYAAEIRSAYEKAMLTGDTGFTDDSAIYTKYVRPAHLFHGERTNRKMTFREDFENNPAASARVGIGIDTHAFGKSQDHVTLCGVRIPSDSGLIAHSDGDVAAHALMDALLSAAGLRDIGCYFPDTDEKWKDADSMKMLSTVISEIRSRGFVPVNASIAIQAQKPRLSGHIPEMVKNVAAVLGIPPDAVGITAGTNEGLGYVGEGRGITVTASVLLGPSPIM